MGLGRAQPAGDDANRCQVPNRALAMSIVAHCLIASAYLVLPPSPQPVCAAVEKLAGCPAAPRCPVCPTAATQVATQPSGGTDASSADTRHAPTAGIDFGPLGADAPLYEEARTFAGFANLGTDRATAHQYQLLYARALLPYRLHLQGMLKERGLRAPDAALMDPWASDKPFRLLEVGLGCTMPVPFGGFHLFRRYLPNAKYHSFEFRPKECFPPFAGGERKTNVWQSHSHEVRSRYRNGKLPPDVRAPTAEHLRYLRESMYEGDQGNETDLAGAVERFGPMDIIVDDGSHCMTHMRTTFRYLFVHMLRPGGTYIVEDLQTNLEKSDAFCFSADSHSARKTFIQYVHDVVTTLSIRRSDSQHLHFGAPFEADDTVTDWIQDVTCDREICAFTKKLQLFNLQRQPLKL